MSAVTLKDLEYLDLKKYGREEIICLFQTVYQKVHKLADNKNWGLVSCKISKC